VVRYVEGMTRQRRSDAARDLVTPLYAGLTEGLDAPLA